MSTIPKNSIDLEKENKQTNPSAHASTNLGKGRRQGLTNSTLFTSQRMATKPKNSIDLEKENKQTNPSAHASTNLGSIGKGRGQGLKSSTFSTSQGMGMKHNNYMTSDSDVGCINKSALYANQHIKTPSKSTRANSTMSSSQEMQRTDKMILEIEDMQTNSFPASIDQVIEHSQITEKGSSNPTKHKFEAFDMNDHRDHIMGWMNELWNKWRRYLHAKYAKDNPIQQSLKNIPRGVDRKEWEWLVKEHFTSESFQKLNVMFHVASASEFLHHGYSVPVIHFDLKRSNVLLDNEMMGHLTDFGIAKLLRKEASFSFLSFLFSD
uniref:Protein kinase-coding resistance protein n=1 Tax=Solanum tuberosum TaxID=4113 RepID=M1CZ03_SOLTU